MGEDHTSYCTVLDKSSQCKFLCYTRHRNGRFSISLTDATDVWSTEYTEDTLNQFRQKFALKSTEDYILKVRSACGRSDAHITVNDSSVELRVGSGPHDLSVTLSRLEGLEAKAEVKELLFRMADGLTQPDGGSSYISPVKNHHRRLTELEPRQPQSCAPGVTVKKRPTGTSLINPGSKKKVRATGVAFDDAEED
ncbi:uncharacterized protein V6R79_024080 [Siganus canaliculatus]